MGIRQAIGLAALICGLLAAAIWVLSEAETESRLVSRETAVIGDGEAPRRVVETTSDGSAPASDSAPTDVSTDVEDATLAGVVVDDDGRPIPNAVVAVFPANTLEVKRLGADEPGSESEALRSRTDGEGRFVSRVEGDLLVVAASREGMAPSRPIEVAPGRHDVRIILSRGVTLRGRVHDLQGQAIAGARVTLSGQWGTVSSKRQAICDESGAYVLSGLPLVAPAKESVLVQAKGFAPRYLSRPLMGTVRSLMGGAEIAFDVALSRGGVVKGFVRDGETGSGVRGAIVDLWSLEGRDIVTAAGTGRRLRAQDGPRKIAGATTDAAGRFRFEGVPARYGGYLVEGRDGFAIRARRRDSAVAVVDIAPIEKEGEEKDVELLLHPAGALTGRIVDGEGHPLVDAFVSVSVHDWKDVPLDFTRTTTDAPAPRDGAFGWRREQGARGFFFLRTDREGRFRSSLVPCVSSGSTRIEILCGGKRRQDFVVAGETLDLGDMVVRRRLAPMRGRVLDQRRFPISGAQVWCEKRRAITDAEGFFSLELEMETGEKPYRQDLVVHAKGHLSLLAKTPDVLSEVVFECLLEDARVLSGIVVDAVGNPVPSADVIVQSTDEDFPFVEGAEAGRDGRFAVQGLGEPPWNIDFSSPRGGPIGRLNGVSVERGEVVLELPGLVPPTASFSVRVSDRRGAALPMSIVARLRAREDGHLSRLAHRASLETLTWYEVPVGDYRLEVSAAGWVSAERDVVVSEAQSDPLAIVLEPGTTVVARVKCPDGVLGDASCQLVAQHESADALHERIPRDGEVLLRGIRTGRWTFTARGDSKGQAFVSRPRRIEVRDSVNPVIVELELLRAAQVEIALPVQVQSDPQLPDLADDATSSESGVHHQKWWNLHFLYKHRAEALRLVMKRDGEIVFDGKSTDCGVFRHDESGVRIACSLVPGDYSVELLRDSALLWRRVFKASSGEEVLLP